MNDVDPKLARLLRSASQIGEDVAALLAALELGPAGARVDGVSAAWSSAVGSFDGFEIRSGWTSGD